METVIEKYKENIDRYRRVSKKTESLMEKLIEEKNIKFHLSESRAKDPESLEKKLKRPDKSYGFSIEDIPDLAGVRVVVHDKDDLKKVKSLIEKNFKIKRHKDSHNTESYDPNKFGYLSDHYVVLLDSPRVDLEEWEEAKGIQIEIQVLTVLQHAWATVSRVQYKREGEVPKSLRRQLNRLAGLFELADEEFVEIKEATKEAIEENKKPYDEETNVDSRVIEKYVRNSESFDELLDQVRSTKKYILPGDEKYDSNIQEDKGKFAAKVAEEMENLGIEEAKKLDDIVSKDYKEFFNEAADVEWSVSREFIMLLVLIASNPSSFSVDRLRKQGWASDIAERVMSAAESTS
jgi:putative GTP pyrophosphokinase